MMSGFGSWTSGSSLIGAEAARRLSGVVSEPAVIGRAVRISRW